MNPEIPPPQKQSSIKELIKKRKPKKRRTLRKKRKSDTSSVRTIERVKKEVALPDGRSVTYDSKKIPLSWTDASGILEEWTYKLKLPETTSSGEENISFTEEDNHPYLFEQSKQITDFNGFIKKLETLEREKKIRKYYNKFNKLVDQLSRLSPGEQIEQYVHIIYNNLDASSTIICYLWNNIIKIYNTYFQAQDVAKRIIKNLNIIFDTYIVPYVTPDTQEKLGGLMNKYKESDYLPLERTLSQFSSITPRSARGARSVRFLETSSKPLKAPAANTTENNFEFWENEIIHLNVPQDTVCYTVPKHSTQLIAATQQRGLFFYDAINKQFEMLKEQTDAKVRYHIVAQKKGDPSIHILKTKAKSVPTATLVAWFAEKRKKDSKKNRGLIFYFRGKRSGKIVVDNREAQTVRKLIGHRDAVTGLVPLHRGGQKLIASSSRDQSIKIWDFLEQRCLQTMQSEIGPLDGLAKVQPNFLASISRQRFLETWQESIQKDKKETVYQFQKTRTREILISTLSIIGYKNCILTGHKNGSLLVWNPESGNCIHEINLDEKPITKLTKNHTALMALQELPYKDKQLTLFMLTPKTN